jgi:hypothetical protein
MPPLAGTTGRVCRNASGLIAHPGRNIPRWLPQIVYRGCGYLLFGRIDVAHPLQSGQYHLDDVDAYRWLLNRSNRTFSGIAR